MIISNPLTYLEWLMLRWASEQPKFHTFFITGKNIVSHFDFTPDANKAARSLIEKGYFSSTDIGRYSINEHGIMASLSESEPLWIPRKIPKFGEHEHKALSALYDLGASDAWTRLTELPGMSRMRLVGALQSLVANGLATAVAKEGSSEIFNKENVLRPTLFKCSRYGWQYMLTTDAAMKLCELDLAEEEINLNEERDSV